MKDHDPLSGIERESGRRYPEWLSSYPALASEPRLVAYFAFESDRKPGSRTLVNQHGHRIGDGAIVGCEWVDGRWPGKGALEFKRPGERSRIDAQGEFQSLTCAAWVPVDAIEHRFDSLMLTDGFDLRIGKAELGNWRPLSSEKDTFPIRNLCGRMDEFALLRAALTPEEVRELYKRGR